MDINSLAYPKQKESPWFHQLKGILAHLLLPYTHEMLVGSAFRNRFNHL